MRHFLLEVVVPKSFASPLWSPAPFYMSAMGMQGARFIEGDTNAGVPDPAPTEAAPVEGEQVDEVSQDDSKKSDSDDLGEGGRKALAAERERAKTAEKQAREAVEKASEREAEVQSLTAQVAERDSQLAAKDLEIARLKALNEFPVPAELQSLVTGNDAESLRKSAELLSKHTKGNGVVHKSGTSGGDPNPSGGSIAAGREMFTANKPKKVGA